MLDVSGPPVDPPPPSELLPGGRYRFESWVLSPSHYTATDPRVTGWATITINGILEPSGTWKIWGTADWDLDQYADEDTWVGEYHGTMRITDVSAASSMFRLLLSIAPDLPAVGALSQALFLTGTKMRTGSVPSWHPGAKCSTQGFAG